MKNKTNKISKIFTVLTLVLLCTLSLGVRIQADDPEEWEESGTILLDKVYYETKTRKLTVEITETSGEIAHEYELYMMIEGELADNIGQFMNLGKLLSILGIMTVDINDTSKIIINGGGKITIKDQELYFGSNEEVKAGTKVLIGVESLDENYNPSRSNLIELTIGGFNVFTSIKMITGGKPAHQTDTLLTWMYYKAFSTGKFGYAAALSFVMALCLGLLAIVQFRMMRNRDN